MIRQNHIPALDGLRGIAVLMVMAFHFIQGNPLSGNQILYWLTKASAFGQTGVDLFFVLSGFLITRILLTAKEDKHYFKNFYIRRFLRILPLYYLFLVITYILLPFLKLSTWVPFQQQFWFWLHIQNIPATFPSLENHGPSHFWSLAVEEHFYLIWPFLVYCLSPRKLMWASLAIILIAILSRFLLISLDIGIFYFTLCRMDELAIGAILAILEIRNSLLSSKKIFSWVASFLLVFLSISWPLLSGQSSIYIGLFKFTAIAVFYFCIIGFLLSLESDRHLLRFMKSEFLVYTGRISYGMYVVHPLCFYMIAQLEFFSGIWAEISASFGLTYLVSTLSYKYYEKPFLALKKYFPYTLN